MMLFFVLKRVAWAILTLLIASVVIARSRSGAGVDV